MPIEIREVSAQRATRKDFINVVDHIYRDDTNYVRPLDKDVADRLHKRRNPFFDHGEACAWVAYRGGKPVGRISASIDHLHIERHRDGAGFFGFFDTEDDSEVATALLEQAAGWLKGKGMTTMRGPFSLAIYEEAGCLVDGFDTPPMIGMCHHLPYQARLIEENGLHKVKDLYAWGYEAGKVPPRAQRAHDAILALPEVTAREVDLKNLDEDLASVMAVFNDAWEDNWGHVPATEREIKKLADDFRLIAMPALTRLVFVDGEVAAVALALPNLNELIAGAKGNLIPFGAAKLLWRLRVRGPKSARMVILGIRKKFRSVRRYAGLSAYLYVSINQSGHLMGIRHAELSWTLDDNAAINVGIKMMGGYIYKTYRVFERALT